MQENPFDFSKMFHFASKGRIGQTSAPSDPSTWPPEWKTTFYKEYRRLPKIELPRSSHKADFFDVAKRRRSVREGSAQGITISEIAAMLEHSCGITDSSGVNRAQPSGGARFPIEAYVIVISGKDIAPGVYHYAVKQHSLEVLHKRNFSKDDLRRLFSRGWFDWLAGASSAFLLTGVLARTQMKYGERGYRYALIEAGHIGHGVCLSAEALGRPHCPFGGTDDREVETLLGIDGITETLLYSIIIG